MSFCYSLFIFLLSLRVRLCLRDTKTPSSDATRTHLSPHSWSADPSAVSGMSSHRQRRGQPYTKSGQRRSRWPHSRRWTRRWHRQPFPQPSRCSVPENPRIQEAAEAPWKLGNRDVLHQSSFTTDAEEQRQSLGCCNQEDASTHEHHDALLEILLNFCKYLILRNYWRHKIAKGTNWKQKFQKPQNENISLTNLNMENKRNFPILSFGLCIEGEVKSLKKESSTWGKVWSEYPNVYELWPKSVKIWHQLEENF